ncbi:MAG: hypothetical protein RL215_3471 [Planctomycetota bacterium]
MFAGADGMAGVAGKQFTSPDDEQPWRQRLAAARFVELQGQPGTGRGISFAERPQELTKVVNAAGWKQQAVHADNSAQRPGELDDQWGMRSIAGHTEAGRYFFAGSAMGCTHARSNSPATPGLGWTRDDVTTART